MVPSAIDSPICGITTGVDIDTFAVVLRSWGLRVLKNLRP
jgi:hypothetical protein